MRFDVEHDVAGAIDTLRPSTRPDLNAARSRLRHGRRRRRGALVILVLVVLLAGGGVAARSTDDQSSVRTIDEPAELEPGPPADAPWEPVSIGTVSAREGLALISTPEGPVIFGGRAAEPGILEVLLVPGGSGPAESIGRVEVSDPSILTAVLVGRRVVAITEAGETVVFDLDSRTSEGPIASPSSTMAGVDRTLVVVDGIPVDLSSRSAFDLATLSWSPLDPGPAPHEPAYLQAVVSNGTTAYVAGTVQETTALTHDSAWNWSVLGAPPDADPGLVATSPSLSLAPDGDPVLLDARGHAAVLGSDGWTPAGEAPDFNQACRPVGITGAPYPLFDDCSKLYNLDTTSGVWRVIPRPVRSFSGTSQAATDGTTIYNLINNTEDTDGLPAGLHLWRRPVSAFGTTPPPPAPPPFTVPAGYDLSRLRDSQLEDGTTWESWNLGTPGEVVSRNPISVTRLTGPTVASTRAALLKDTDQSLAEIAADYPGYEMSTETVGGTLVVVLRMVEHSGFDLPDKETTFYLLPGRKPDQIYQVIVTIRGTFDDTEPAVVDALLSDLVSGT